MATTQKRPTGRLILALMAVGLPLAMPVSAATPEEEITAIIRRASLEEEPNPVVLEMLLAPELHRLDEAQRARAEQQVIEGLRDRALVTAFDSMGAMMGSTKDVMKAQFKPKNLLRNTLGLGGDQSEANQILGEAIVGPWVRGLAAAGTLAEAGYVDDATGFYQRCLADSMLAGANGDEALGSEFGQWVRARCEKELVDLGVEVAGPVFSDLAAGNSGSPMTQTEESAPVARAAGLSGFGALLDKGRLEVEQRVAVVDAALAVLDQPKKKLDDALASAAADVLGTTGDPRARDALLNLADQAKSGRFRIPGRGSELAGAARSAKLALARGFDHPQSLDQLRDELLGGKTDDPWEAFEVLFDREAPEALTFAREQFERMNSQDPATWAEPLIERLGFEGGPLSLETLHDAEPVTVPTDAYVQAKLAVTLFESGERERLPALAAAIERESWNLGGSAVRQGTRMLKPLAKVVARQALGLPVPQGPSDQMLVDFAFGAADQHDRQQEAEAIAVRKMRLRVATALATWDDPRALPLIERLMVVGDEAVHIGAARALIGQTSPATVPVLLAALDLEYGADEDESRAPEIQAALLLHAGRTFDRDPSAVAALADFDRFEHDSVRFLAAALAQAAASPALAGAPPVARPGSDGHAAAMAAAEPASAAALPVVHPGSDGHAAAVAAAAAPALAGALPVPRPGPELHPQGSDGGDDAGSGGDVGAEPAETDDMGTFTVSGGVVLSNVPVLTLLYAGSPDGLQLDPMNPLGEPLSREGVCTFSLNMMGPVGAGDDESPYLHLQARLARGLGPGRYPVATTRDYRVGGSDGSTEAFEAQLIVPKAAGSRGMPFAATGGWVEVHRFNGELLELSYGISFSESIHESHNPRPVQADGTLRWRLNNTPAGSLEAVGSLMSSVESAWQQYEGGVTNPVPQQPPSGGTYLCPVDCPPKLEVPVYGPDEPTGHRDPVLSMAPADFAEDEAAQDQLFEMAKDVRARQQEFGDGLLATTEHGGSVVSILKRNNKEDFIAGVVAKARDRNDYRTIGEMDDMVRGRFDLRHPDDVKKVAEILLYTLPVPGELDDEGNPVGGPFVRLPKTELPRRPIEVPECPCDGAGYPRYHVIVQDTETGITHEWQIGTGAVSDVYELAGVTFPHEMWLDFETGALGPDLHDVDYDIFRQGVKKHDRRHGENQYEELGLKDFGQRIDALSAAAHCRGYELPDLQERISDLHAEASDLLQKVVDHYGIEQVQEWYH